MLPEPGRTFVIYGAGVFLVVAGMVALSAILGERGERKADRRGGRDPYESGIVATGSARLRFDVPFYLVAMLFVLFDLEVVFLLAWAVAFRELPVASIVGAMLFLLVLVVGLFYEWRQGALDWAPELDRRGRDQGGEARPWAPTAPTEAPGITEAKTEW